MAHSVRYQIRVRVQGELAPTWSAVFADLAVVAEPDGTTVVSGELVDLRESSGRLTVDRHGHADRLAHSRLHRRPLSIPLISEKDSIRAPVRADRMRLRAARRRRRRRCLAMRD